MSVTIDTKAEKTIITCNTCKKSTIKLDGTRSKRQGYAKAIELGWRWKDANTQICPSCRKLTDKATVAKTGKTAKAEKSATKSVGKLLRFGKNKPTNKPNGAQPFTAGQSIGKMARTAKVEAKAATE